MKFRGKLNDRLRGWKYSGGARQTIKDIVKRGSRNGMVVLGASVVIFMIAIALLAPILPMANPNKMHLKPDDPIQPRQGPSSTNLFGTDENGRDVFSRVIWGTRVSLTVGSVAVLLSLAIGLVLGLTAGYYGGAIDYLISGTVDLFWTFPAFLLALAITAAVGQPSLMNVVIAIGISYWAGFARLMRGQALTVRERQYVEASRALGASNARIMFTHVLPNCLAPLIVWASIGVADAIVIESSLSFLGVGTQPPTPSWGYMLSSGKVFLDSAPWISAFPGIFMLLTILGFNLLGDGLRDVLDPRLKGVRR